MKKAKTKRKSASEMIVGVEIRAGDAVYDITHKRPEDFPDELKEALIPAQRFYARVMLDGSWQRFLDGMPPDLKAMYDAAPTSEQFKVYRYWAKTLLRNEFGVEDN